MWRKRSHLITPLAALSSLSKSVPFTWTQQCQKSFEDITKIVAQEVQLNYPNFNVPFDIYTDASEKQLGAVIIQSNKPKIEWQHIKGEHNTVADALSQLPINDSKDDTEMEEANSPTDIAYAVMRKKEVQETNFPMNPS
jgi:hypothetical protein